MNLTAAGAGEGAVKDRHGRSCAAGCPGLLVADSEEGTPWQASNLATLAFSHLLSLEAVVSP